METEQPKRVRLVNVHHGSSDQGRDHFIYAHLRDAETGDLLISASLDYIVQAVRNRGYVFAGDPKTA